ncbi:putative phosphoribosylformylglycinamidine cyclo-ligase [Rosa chinensis]|uniref:Putative phosphoribosylformylglycinamidine cyclo-ligase n=1 Tax=Rosa chinensis TaxID=74649 RepID=A0A2P6RRJ2_ROSCH|nr:putative phosphoribosylformylglycinamidine cyclo-ligase [Rosa chinensis]
MWYPTEYGMFHFYIADREHDWREGTEKYKFFDNCLGFLDRQKMLSPIFLTVTPYKGRKDESSCSLKTFTELLKHSQNYLKVLNHIRGLEEQHASNISLFLEPSHYFFLDYFLTSCLDVYLAEKVIKGIVDGCQQSDCAFLGGETHDKVRPRFHPGTRSGPAGPTFKEGLPKISA